MDMAQAAPEAAEQPKAANDTYLTIDQALDFVNGLGFRVNRRQMQRWAHEKKLPFFRWGKFLYIDQNELRLWFKRLQFDAVRQQSKR